MITLKVSNIRHLTDARYFSARGASVMGFRLDPNANDFIRPEVVSAIIEWVDGVEFAGEFQHTGVDEMVNLGKSLKLNYLQIPHFFEKEKIAELTDFKLIRQIVWQTNTCVDEVRELINDQAHLMAAFELNFSAAGLNPLASEGVDWEDLNDLLQLHHIFINAPFSLDTIANLKKLDPLPGLTFSGSDEEKTGFKSFENIDLILDYLEEEGLFDPFF